MSLAINPTRYRCPIHGDGVAEIQVYSRDEQGELHTHPICCRCAAEKLMSHLTRLEVIEVEEVQP